MWFIDGVNGIVDFLWVSSGKFILGFILTTLALYPIYYVYRKAQ